MDQDSLGEAAHGHCSFTPTPSLTGCGGPRGYRYRPKPTRATRTRGARDHSGSIFDRSAGGSAIGRGSKEQPGQRAPRIASPWEDERADTLFRLRAGRSRRIPKRDPRRSGAEAIKHPRAASPNNFGELTIGLRRFGRPHTPFRARAGKEYIRASDCGARSGGADKGFIGHGLGTPFRYRLTGFGGSALI